MVCSSKLKEVANYLVKLVTWLSMVYVWQSH